MRARFPGWRAQDRKGKKPRKYRNVKGGGYDSRAEARVGLALESARTATDPAQRVAYVERQRRFNLIPAQRDAQGNTLERAVDFIVDFWVVYADGREEVIDVKSPVTRRLAAYILKRKMLLLFHGVRVREIE